MNSSVIEREVTATEFRINEQSFTVALSDGRTITIPLVWFPRLLHATSEERKNYQFIGDGEGIHWKDLDEDISIEGLIAGRRSGESAKSLGKWLDKRG